MGGSMSGRYTFSLVTVIILAVAIGVLVGKSQPLSVAAPAPPATATPIVPPPAGEIEIIHNPGGSPSAIYLSATSPVVATGTVGQKITWVNKDSQPHTVTADNGAFNSNVLNPGERFSWTPKHAGTYTYGSYLDPDMHGTLIIQ
jgi:Cupredoxin-like domain